MKRICVLVYVTLLLLSIACNEDNLKDDLNQYPLVRGYVYGAKDEVIKNYTYETSDKDYRTMWSALWYCPSNIYTHKYREADTILTLQEKIEKKVYFDFVDDESLIIKRNIKNTYVRNKAKLTSDHFVFSGRYTNETGQVMVNINPITIDVYDKINSVRYALRMDSDLLVMR